MQSAWLRHGYLRLYGRCWQRGRHRITAQPYAQPLDRIPPHNIEAGMALLGSILVDRELMDTIAAIVRPTDFYAHVHESIFQTLLELSDASKPVDKLTLAEALRNKGQLDKVGGPAYLSALMNTVQTAASAKYYATIVREKSTLRA